MTRTSTCVYHLFVLSWYIFLNFYISLEGKDPRISLIFQKGGKWKYLTLLNLLLQAIFFGVACLEDVLKRTKGEKDIKFVTAFRDLLFTTLAFPLSTFVFLAFWIIFLYDRELIYPKVLDTVFPVWLNHAMCVKEKQVVFVVNDNLFSLDMDFKGSTQCRLLLLNAVKASVTENLPSPMEHSFRFPVEVILRPHCYPLRKKGLTLLTAAGLAYVSRTLWIYSETGTWVYPVFAKLSPVGLAALFSLSHIFIIGIYLFGEKLNHWKWEILRNTPSLAKKTGTPRESCRAYLTLTIDRSSSHLRSIRSSLQPVVNPPSHKMILQVRGFPAHMSATPKFTFLALTSLQNSTPQVLSA
ncbi:hypothetical protein MJT46_017312 [Ovis ammon polii x Ovis aries]|nr:hypothetical protein MJT46_017312 [Ovis ammon polii x Ovis aries]